MNGSLSLLDRANDLPFDAEAASHGARPPQESARSLPLPALSSSRVGAKMAEREMAFWVHRANDVPSAQGRLGWSASVNEADRENLSLQDLYPPLPPGAGTHRSICSKDDGGGVNASTSRISTSWRRSRGRTRSKSRKDIAAGPIPPPPSSRSNGTPAKGRWDRVNDGDTGRENSHSRSHPTTARHSDPKHRRTRPL
jgi:hypothetical protein